MPSFLVPTQGDFYGWHRIFWRKRSSTTRSHTCQHHAEIAQSHTFAALIRLSTTTHNLLTFNTSEISSNNSEKLSLLADKHLWTFLLQHKMLQNVNSCGEVLTPSLKVTMLSDFVALKQQCLTSKQEVV